MSTKTNSETSNTIDQPSATLLNIEKRFHQPICTTLIKVYPTLIFTKSETNLPISIYFSNNFIQQFNHNPFSNKQNRIPNANLSTLVRLNFKRTRQIFHQRRSQVAIIAIAITPSSPNSVTKEEFSQHQELNIPAYYLPTKSSFHNRRI